MRWAGEVSNQRLPGLAMRSAPLLRWWLCARLPWLAGWLAGCPSVWLQWLAGWLQWLAGWLALAGSVCLPVCLPAWLCLAVCLCLVASVFGCLSGCLSVWLAGWLSGWQLSGWRLSAWQRPSADTADRGERCLVVCLSGRLAAGWLPLCACLSALAVLAVSLCLSSGRV
jgi:hypothetical protein